jgi:hypothetical protein
MKETLFDRDFLSTASGWIALPLGQTDPIKKASSTVRHRTVEQGWQLSPFLERHVPSLRLRSHRAPARS